MSSTHHPTALVVAHPGHEIRIHGWLEQTRPRVFILTDGSGRVGQSRITSTTEYLKKFGLRPGSIYGRLTDREVYGAVLRREFGLFIRLSDELADALVAAGAERIVGDASEGYNTTHDICRLLINAAAEMAARGGGRSISNYDFTIVHRPDHCHERLRRAAIWLHLDDAAFSRKIAAAFEFYPELAAETRNTLEGRGHPAAMNHFPLDADSNAATDLKGLDMFRIECLRPVAACDAPFESEPPFYEWLGEMRVAEGLYEQAIRYGEHLLPLSDALTDHVERKV